MSTVKKTKKTKTTTAQLPPVETYLFYPKISKAQQKGNFVKFFDKLENLDEQLTDALIFLNKKSAFQYSNFIKQKHVVLKAFVPHIAIEGRTDGLTLKKGFVTKTHIHGCFVDLKKNSTYIENPHFNSENFPVAESE